MINNGMFTNHYEIISRISKLKLEKDFDPDTVHDWCAEAENDILRDNKYFTKFLSIPLPIKNERYITFPCNVHSIIDLRFKSNVRPAFHMSGVNAVLVNPTKENHVLIDYKGTPVDPETGDVLILRGHELFCVWHCVKNSFLTDYLNGRIDGQRWSVIDQEHERATNVAVMDLRHYNRKDFEIMSRIQSNILPQLGRVPLYKDV